MRIAFFHTASRLGSSLARSLVDDGRDEVVLVEPAAPDALHDRARAFAPDLVVVGTFPSKLPPALLALPRLAAINVHASLLPRHRGALPEFWAIRNGDTETGVSIHLMTDRFDAGPVVARRAVPIRPRDTLLTLTDALCAAAPPLLASVIEAYREGRPPPATTQDEALATSAPMVREHHLRIDFAHTAEAIDRLVRAAYPAFGAHTRARDELIFVRAAAPVPAMPLGPGELRVDDAHERVLVGTGDGALQIIEIDTRAEGVIGAHAFARARALRSGERLG